MRTPRPAFIALTGVLVLSGCAVAAAATLPAPTPATPTRISVRNVEINRTFNLPPGTAVTYDRDLVPIGSRGAVSAKSDDGTPPSDWRCAGCSRSGATARTSHDEPCGDTGASAGPTFQNVVDPVQPSVDPTYANPQNEIWLDFRTDEAGAGSSQATVDWRVHRRSAREVRRRARLGRPRPRPDGPGRRAARSAA